jgi:chemotaxis regulatin CheY-phosphate phosphatase CheZ
MSIQHLAQQYNEFMTNFGAATEIDQSQFIEKLFTADFQKIANGIILTLGRKELENQLIEIKKTTGSWTIEPIKISPAANNKECTIRFMAETEKAGKFDVIAILSSEDNVQISKIDEIYYQV